MEKLNNLPESVYKSIKSKLEFIDNWMQSGISIKKIFVSQKMIRIPEGNFLYGPLKEVFYLDDYEIGTFPVTNFEYKEFIDDNPDYPLPRHWNEAKRTFPKKIGEHPAVNVTFRDAQSYCEWKTEIEGTEYRLPSEHEWEKAARGIEGRKYPWGNEFDTHKCNTIESRINDTTPVDKYPEGISPYGCFDMVGNVWEWTDSESPYYWDEYRVLRGGSWDSIKKYSNCTHGYPFPMDMHSAGIGFRCIRIIKK